MARRLIALLLVVLVLVAPGARAAAAVTGRVALPAHATLPSNSQFDVAVVDLDALDEDARVLGSLRILGPLPLTGQTLRFTIPLDTGRLAPTHRYAVRAVVTQNDTVLYSGERSLTARGPFAGVTVALAAAEAVDGGVAPPLGGTDWVVTEVDGDRVHDGEAPLSLQFTADGRLSGFAGCNRYNARFEQAETSLKITALALTRMACAPTAMTVEARFTASLGAAVSARLNGEALELRDTAGVVRLRLEAHRPH